MHPTHAAAAVLVVTLAGCAPEAPTGSSSAPEAPVAAPSWSARVSAGIAAAEYAPRADGSGFRVTNRAQDLRGVFGEGGLTVTDRDGAGELRLSLRAWGRDGALTAAEGVFAQEGDCLSGGDVDEFGACLRRVQYARSGLIEWWENRAEGLEQGFTVTDPPVGDGLLVFELALAGAVAEVDGEEARLVRDAGEALTFGQLAAWDEVGQDLPAWLEEADHGLRIVVDDDGAVGAVTVDPLLASSAWTAESDQEDAMFGYAVASAGDVNGDGYDDVVIGAQYYDNGEGGEGRAYVYLGSPTGLSTVTAWTAESDQVGAAFGVTVASAGDVNGDGFDDVLVGADLFDNGEENEGRAFLYLGSPAGLSATAAWTAESDQEGASLGYAVAAAGDVNGDGFDDVLVGAAFFENGEINEGRAYLYLGSPSGLSTIAAWTAEADQETALFGGRLASAGDVNGDGYDDVVVGAFSYDNGAESEGRAFVYLGSSSGLETSAAWTAESDGTYAKFAAGVGSAGDVNGDGYDDVVVGSHYYDDGESHEGRAYVYLGSSSGLASSATWAVESNQEEALFGWSVGTAGDVNGDGYDDVVVGAIYYDNGETDEGGAFLYLGSSAGLATSAAWTGESNQAGANFGHMVASAGDVNGDGYDDLLVGAWDFENGEAGEGRAFVYCGSSTGPGGATGVPCASTPGPTVPDTGATDTGATSQPDDTDAPTVDTSSPQDTPPADDSDPPSDDDAGGCGCATTPGPAAGWFLLLPALALARRRQG